MPEQSPPPVRQKPKLAHWMFERDIKPPAAAERLQVSPVQVRRYLLPFGDAERQVPGEDVLARIIEWTDGAVTAGDFYPPHLNGADVDVLRAARAS